MATAQNTAQLSFGVTTAVWPSAPTHASLWEGTTFVGATPLTSPPASVGANQTVVIEPMMMTITLPAGEAAAAFAQTMLERVFTAALEVRLHSGDPGDAGTANQISGNGYAHATVNVADIMFEE